MPPWKLFLDALDSMLGVDLLPVLSLLLAHGLVVSRAGFVGSQTGLPVFGFVGYADKLDVLYDSISTELP